MIAPGSAPVGAESRAGDDAPPQRPPRVEPTAAAIAAELGALRERDAELAGRERAAAANVDGLRAAIGDTVARGEDPRRLRDELRDAEDDADGFRRGRATIADDVARRTHRHAAAVLREAQDAERAAVAAAVDAGERLEAAVGAFLRDTFGPLDSAFRAAAEAARYAENKAAGLRGGGVIGAGAVYNRAVHRSPALRDLAPQIRHFLREQAKRGPRADGAA